MLPDWDFDGDEGKRRTFIEWVWAELDRLAVLTTESVISDGQATPDVQRVDAHVSTGAWSETTLTYAGRPTLGAVQDSQEPEEKTAWTVPMALTESLAGPEALVVSEEPVALEQGLLTAEMGEKAETEAAARAELVPAAWEARWPPR